MNGQAGRLLIRADGGPVVGHGHVMRCVALAQAWQARGGVPIFVSSLDESLRRSLAAAGFETVPIQHAHPEPDDLDVVLQLLETGGFDAVVLDGYHLDPGYQGRVRARTKRLLVVDDTAHLEHYDADAILNQNLGAEELEYDSDAELLLGPRYALLRAEFARKDRVHPDRAERVLVTVGGGAHDSALRKVVDALETLELEVRVAAGVAPAEIPRMMADADIAVTAAGSTCWELAYMGVPFAALILAPNQGRNATGLAAAGAAVLLGRIEELSAASIRAEVGTLADDAERRRAMSAACTELVDGGGAARVAAYLAGERS
ncbi:MAG TPA: glycosyltransferase [Gaiellaceae bacterium]